MVFRLYQIDCDYSRITARREFISLKPAFTGEPTNLGLSIETVVDRTWSPKEIAPSGMISIVDQPIVGSIRWALR
jgi:hypothetical protein